MLATRSYFGSENTLSYLQEGDENMVKGMITVRLFALLSNLTCAVKLTTSTRPKMRQSKMLNPDLEAKVEYCTERSLQLRLGMVTFRLSHSRSSLVAGR